MRTSWGMGAVLALAIVASSSSARAQSADPPFDSAIDVQTFNYAIGPKSFFSVADGDVAAPKQLAFDAMLTYLTRPFTIYDVDPANPDMVGPERTQVVKSVAAMQITGAYGVNDKLQVGARLPVIFQLSGDGLMPETGDPAPNGLSVTGLGDLDVEGKYRLYRKDKLRLAGIAGLTLPSSIGSDGSQFIGDDLPTLHGAIAMQYDVHPKLTFGANAGILLRKPRTIYESTIGQQLTWGAAATVRVTNRFSIVGEAFGRAGLPDFSLDASPLEALGGLRVFATNSVAVVIGGGGGLVKGIGSPKARFFLSIGYSPDVRDSDGDGIQNARDKCPLIPEDKDGAQDDDGCPDDDNDGDRRPDATDKCPEISEDIDGFDDDDGCPELDNDGDKQPDLQDKCPNDAEDGAPPFPADGCPASMRDSDQDGVFDAKDACAQDEEDLDGFEDGDGCPEGDNDNDGVADAADKCAVCPEDKDGFQDDDGCPELDNDKDGVADQQDRCPAEAESLNGIRDDDGCPDAGGTIIAKVDGDRLQIDRVPTLQGAGLSAAGNLIVDDIALLMVAHGEVTKWLIALSQPKLPDAQRLAEAVKNRLIAKGVPADRLQVIGAAGAPKIGGVVQERADDATPICPVGKEVKQRPEAIKAPDPKAKNPASPPTVPPKTAPAKEPQEPEIEMD